MNKHIPWSIRYDDRREYYRAYYHRNKARKNRERVANRRKRNARQRAWLESLGLWPIIPEHRQYEIPPNLRLYVLAREAKLAHQHRSDA